MSIYTTLADNQKFFSLSTSESDFNEKYKNLISDYLVSEESPLRIFRQNIYIYGVLNKFKIDEIINSCLAKNESEYVCSDKLHEAINSMSSFHFNKQDILIPFISSADNEKLLNYPYQNYEKKLNIIDPFDEYGYHVFDSQFTTLVKIKEYNGFIAFYHYDTRKIFIINKQGRIENVICLFDKYLDSIDENDMLYRTKPVVESYFSFSLNQMIDDLLNNHLISEKMYTMLKE